MGRYAIPGPAPGCPGGWEEVRVTPRRNPPEAWLLGNARHCARFENIIAVRGAGDCPSRVNVNGNTFIAYDVRGCAGQNNDACPRVRADVQGRYDWYQYGTINPWRFCVATEKQFACPPGGRCPRTVDVLSDLEMKNDPGRTHAVCSAGNVEIGYMNASRIAVCAKKVKICAEK